MVLDDQIINFYKNKNKILTKPFNLRITKVVGSENQMIVMMLTMLIVNLISG